MAWIPRLLSDFWTEETGDPPPGSRPETDPPAGKPHRLPHVLMLSAVGACGILAWSSHRVIERLPPDSVWVASSLERAGPEDPAGDRKSAALYAARGEYEAFQIVIKGPPEGFHHVSVAASSLTGPGERVIPGERIAIYLEHYVKVAQPSPDWEGRNRSLGAGWYPDGLIRLAAAGAEGSSQPESFDVDAGRNQPLWVDVSVPRDAAPGAYTGGIRIASDEGIAHVPLTVNVWDFELPLKPSLKSSFGYAATNEALVEELLRHKIMPLRLRGEPCFREPCDGLAQAERGLMDRLGLAITDIGFWSGADVSNCRMKPAPAVEELRAAAAVHPDGLELVNYTADEIGSCPQLFPAVKDWGANLHRADIKNLVVMQPAPELFDDGLGNGRSAVDIWVVSPANFDKAADFIREALKKGDEVWSYNALVPDPFSPKWLIDYEPVNFRIQPGFLSQSLQLTGILYWRVDSWSADPWNQVNNVGVYSPEANYPGEGMLLYPGENMGLPGVAPSIRLKQLREGVEDYEYVELLKRLGGAEQAIEISRKVAPGWSDWTRDRGDLEAARRALGEEIERLQRDAPPSP